MFWAKRYARFSHDRSHTFKATNLETTANPKNGRVEQLQHIKMQLELLCHKAILPGNPY